MTWRFDDPRWLALLLIAIPCSWAAWTLLRAMSRARRASAILLRVALLGVLAAALAGLATARRVDHAAAIIVFDVSPSVARLSGSSRGGAARAAAEDAVRALGQRDRRARGDLFGVVSFGSRAVAVLSPARVGLGERAIMIDAGEETDLAGALRQAAAMLPPDAAGRLVLVSDGNQTTGDALAAAEELAGMSRGLISRGVPVDVVPIEYELSGEVALERVDAPPRAAAASRVGVRVTLRAQAPASGSLTLLVNGVPADANGAAPGVARRVELPAGESTQVIDVDLDQGHVHRFRAVFEPDSGGAGDVNLDNNTADAFTITPGRGRVLLADGALGREGAASSPLGESLTRAGIDVTRIAPAGVPGDLVGLQPYDVVILENVPADAMSEDARRTLAEAAGELGIGLVMVGGDASFGAGGWKGTPIEPILPVSLDLPERLMAPELAIVFVLDSSGSMRRSVMGSARSQQEIANESAAAAVRTLDRRDLVGVVAFDNNARVVVPLAPVDDPEGVAERIRGIAPNGGTNIPPGLELAAEQLKDVEAKVRHIIVLTDGKSEGTEELATMASDLAAGGIRVSTIGIGDDADLATLEAMAEAGDGAFYPVSNPNILPRVFARAVRVVRTPMIREGDFVPVMTAPDSPYLLGLGEVPVLGGLSLTQTRPEPTVVQALLTPEGEPVLSHWNVGLGQVVAFTSDAGRWAGAWLNWPGYERFWAGVVRGAARPATPPGFEPEVRIVDGRAIVRLSAADESGAPKDGLTVRSALYAPDGSRVDVELPQVGPGAYQASIPVERTGSYIAMIKTTENGTPAPPVIAGASHQGGRESRALESNRALLAAIAERTGGRVIAPGELAAADLFDRSGLAPQYVVRSLWPVLLVAAIPLLLLDIATRRVAWDRFQRDAEPGPARSVEGGALRAARARASADAGALALDDTDAERLRAAARDRRRAARIDRRVPVAPAAPPEPSPPSDLLAAKRRAAERFDESKNDAAGPEDPAAR